MNQNDVGGSSASRLIFACSGVADVGEIADKTARKLHREGAGKMWCLAGIGAGLNNFIEATRTAGQVLIIDGCPIDCGRKMMLNAGITDTIHLRITDLGFEKGKSPASDTALEAVATKGRSLLKGETA